MKTIVYRRYGGPGVLTEGTMPMPVPSEGDILVKVRATTVAMADVRLRKADPFLARLFNGLFRPGRVNTLGLEFAGDVVDVGSLVTQFKPGDRVFGTTGFKFGTYAEYVCLPANGEVCKVPDELPYIHAAAIPVGAITAWYYLFEKGSIKRGNRILIYGASGSVGTYALQLAKHHGTIVTAVCSNANRELMHLLHADEIIAYDVDDLGPLERKYDFVFDAVGKLSEKQATSLLCDGGRIVSVRHGQGLSCKGILPKLARLASNGQIVPVIDRVYRMGEIQQAHEYVDTGRKKGNVVIDMDPW